MDAQIPAGPRRDRLEVISKCLSELSVTFQKNRNEDQSGIWLTPQELNGVPEDFIGDLQKSEAGTGNGGKLHFTLKHLDQTRKYCNSAETEYKWFIQDENWCELSTALFREVFVLRNEVSRILGYPNPAIITIENKMAKTRKEVNGFLEGLRTYLMSIGNQDLAQLKEVKKNDTGEADNYFL